MLARMSGRELAEWVAFDAIDPIGAGRGDLQAAIVASTIANVWRPKNKRAYKIQDFIPKFKRPKKRRQTWQQQLTMVEMLNAAFGGRDLRGSNRGKTGHANR